MRPNELEWDQEKESETEKSTRTLAQEIDIRFIIIGCGRRRHHPLWYLWTVVILFFRWLHLISNALA